MATRKWSKLKATTRHRYLIWGKSQGWSTQKTIGYYRSGGSMKAARGKGRSPEKPAEAQRHPERYPEYQRSQRRLAIARRSAPVRVMSDEGVLWVRGLKKYDRSRVGRHWNRVKTALRRDSEQPLKPYRDSHIAVGYDGVESMSGLDDPDDENLWEGINDIPLADDLATVRRAIKRDEPVRVEFIYGV